MDVRHDESGGRFYARTESGEAVLDYGETPEGVLDLRHTHVPEGDREKGTGGALVKAAIEYARQNGLSVRPTCPFVRSWLKQNPEAYDLVESG